MMDVYIRILWVLTSIAISGALPTRDILHRRIPSIPSSCAFCNNFPETIVHIFWECTVAKGLWLKFWNILVDKISFVSRHEFIMFIISPVSHPSSLDFPLFRNWSIAMMESLWFARNLMIFEKAQFVDIGKLSRRISSQVSLISISLKTPSIQAVQKDTPISSPPADRTISCDAAVQPFMSAIACVVRDPEGREFGCVTRKLPSNAAVIVETQAVWEAVCWARRENWNSCFFESDSSDVINAILNGKSYPNWNITNTVTDINLVAREYPNWKFIKISRLDNCSAHNLAQSFLLSPN